MSERSAIEWTDDTWNPWWGCERVSPACDFCYAESLAKRYGHAVWGEASPRRLFGDDHWAEPLRWNRKAQAAGVPRRVFCASMGDVFEDRRDLDAERARLWELVEATPFLRWLLLTKRPQNAARLAPEEWQFLGWPPNVWLGTTAEDQAHANVRIRRLLEVPVHEVRFVSYEPALGPVDFSEWLGWGIGWLICGGESGPKARPMEASWARSARDQCAAAGVPFFFKQWGQWAPGDDGRRSNAMVRWRSKRDAGKLLDGAEHCAVPDLGWNGVLT